MSTIRSWFTRSKEQTQGGPVARENYWTLLYLIFLFSNFGSLPLGRWLPPTLLSIALFLPLYLRLLRCQGTRVLPYAFAIAVIGFALAPFNTTSNTYLIYAAAVLPLSSLSLRTSLLLVLGGLVLFVLNLLVVGYPPRYALLIGGVSAVIAVAICAANHHQRQERLRQAELKLSHEEIRRLAGLAERERIGRDLHDLLGHTLSLITLKSELAVKLLDRDPGAARREIADVERVARDALGQVRRAVAGIRSAGLAAELASARLLLESSDVRLEYALAERALPAEIETVLALVVREAITNVQRHAHAGRVRVDLASDPRQVRLTIEDDGHAGKAPIPGNGIRGMRERLATLGGELRVDCVPGGGTRVTAVVPMTTAGTQATAALA